MRKSNMNDAFNVMRLLTELDLKDDLFNAQKGNTDDVEQVGFNLIFGIMAKASTKHSQEMIYETLAEPFEMTVEEIGQMSIEEVADDFLYCFDLKKLLNFMNRVK